MLVWLPRGTDVAQLAGVGLAPGLLSAGLGSVPLEQMYLDVTQGNRVFDSLYSSKLPEMAGRCSASWWEAVTERAESAPADIIPGLLTTTLQAAGIGVLARGGASCTFSAPTTSDGARQSPKKLSGTPGQNASAPVFEVRDGTLDEVSSLAESLGGNDLLVVIATPPPAKNRQLAIGVAGAGFEGNLTSGSTRTDGYVLSTDLAPTILDWFGLPVPAEMSGEPIRAEGEADPAALESLGARMAVISQRRGPVIGYSLLIWVGLLVVAAAIGRAKAARIGVRLVGVAVVYLPLVLLICAASEPGEATELAVVAIGAPALAALTLALLSGYRALGVAAGLTVLAYAVDMVVGSPLTSLSLLGPNPGLGVRFYGIGNELEAVLSVLIVAGTGAALSGFMPTLAPRRAAAAFLVTGLVGAFVFAAGRFGADVGAAIVFPVGAAAAAAALAPRRRTAWLLLALPFAALALLAAIDLASGANAHLTRSVLDAGGFSDLADVAQRRLRLSARSFARPALAVLLPVVIGLAALAFARRDRIRAWIGDRSAMRAGLLGALAAVAVGTIANDSGALLLEVGAAYLLVFVGFAWAEADSARP